MQEVLSSRYPSAPQYIEGPWLKFVRKGEEKPSWCQPDGLLIDILKGKITVVEIKLKHTPLAWWQVRELYQPVLQHIFPPSLWKFSAVEIVKWVDPDTQFPERFSFVPDISRVPDAAFGVHRMGAELSVGHKHKHKSFGSL